MSKIWYCPNCGYEVDRGGRCHSCREALIASPLPQLVDTGGDEVGYRLGDWEDETRGELIDGLVDNDILHRFEDDELIISAADERVVDALVVEVTGGDEVGGEAGEMSDGDMTSISALLDAARRLEAEPTDMMADADVSEAAAVVFLIDGVPGVDDDNWAGIGRVTRRLLRALSAEEALEAEIVIQAGILVRLLVPVVTGPPGQDPVVTGPPGQDPVGSKGEVVVYEVTGWLPEQRGELTFHLDRAGIAHHWESDDLVVTAEREAEVDALFDQIEGPSDNADGQDVDDQDVDDEERYKALEELFGASDRLIHSPDDEDRARHVQAAIDDVVEGPAPFAMDEGHWRQIKLRSRELSDSLEGDGTSDQVRKQATAVRDLLRELI